MICPFVLLLINATSAATGTVVIHSTVLGGKLFVDEQPLGSTPTSVHLAPGSHVIRLQKKGYLDADETVTVQAGKTLDLTLDPLPFAGVLKVLGPKAAQVIVDGKMVGVAPYEGEIAIGKRQIEIKKEGYSSLRETLQAGAGTTYTLNANLQHGHDSAANDLPLVALPSRHKKDKPTTGDDDELPLVAPVPVARAPLVVQPTPGLVASHTDDGARPWFKQWWVWGTAGAVVTASVVVAIVASSPGRPAFAWQQ